jgi:tetratricopeptide (TPR) repeat protein/predicted Ser/Thr protein kinase
MVPREDMLETGQTRDACPKCGHFNALGASTCAWCDTPNTLGSGPTVDDVSPSRSAPASEERALVPGTVIADRYEIIKTLGAGGMGAVYQTFDRRLSRVVALKTIHPHLATTPSLMKRFKQEVLLAQKVVHKNVVRIFDIGEDGPLKFITMDFITGVDLHKLLEGGRLPAEEAISIIRQICFALQAAHAEGVVHRDLKPQNIMIEDDRHVVVMDFGIARSTESAGATQTGSLLGTPDYMSPEQARMQEADARSDIFSMGLIFYVLLTGTLPYKGETVVETMFKRTKERAIPPAEVNHNIPKGANEIVVKCLELEPEKRYQSVGEILTDLEALDPSKKAGAAVQVKGRLRRMSRYRNLGAAAMLALVALLAGFTLRNRLAAPPQQTAAHAPVTVVIADFSNHTGEPIFDGALEPVVKMALEGAGFITAYDRTAVVRALGVPLSSRLDEPAARQIAVGQGVGFVVSGSLDRRGDAYALSIKANQAVTGETIQIAEESASKKDQVLFATTKLAAAIRKALGDDTSESAQRFAMETLSANSLEAVHEYAAAMDALSNTRYEEALTDFSKAVDVDQNFGLAYAGMAVAYANLDQQQDAEKYIKLALAHLDRMTERERLRTRGSYYVLTGDERKCVEEYGELISRFPSDAAAHNNMAFCWMDLRNIRKGLEEERQAAAILPKRALYRSNTSMYASFAGDLQTAERDARASQELDPSARLGFTVLAYSQMAQGALAQAVETYQKLEKLSNLGSSDAQLGLADVALYEGRFADAVRILEQGIADDLAEKYLDRAALKSAALAYTRLSQGQKPAAVAAAEKALATSQTIKIQFLAGRVFAAAGQTSRAQGLARELASKLQNEPQAYARLIDGEVALARGDARTAINTFVAANNLLSTWIGHFGLGRAYLEAGAFTEADSEFDQCIKRRGEALSLFLSQSPTYGFFPPVYYYLGRAREGLKSEGFAESYRTYLSIRGKAGEDPLLAEVRKKAGSQKLQ